MAQGIAKADETGKNIPERARQLAQTAQEIKTAADFARFMTAVMAGLITKEIDPQTANSIVSTANVMLKAIEMQIKYANAGKDGNKSLHLTEAPAPVVTNVTCVTPKALSKPESEPAPPPPPPIDDSKPPSNGRKDPWCVDCYVKRKHYITAVQIIDEDNLCRPCANARLREISR